MHYLNANEVLMVKTKAVILCIYYHQQIQIRNKTNGKLIDFKKKTGLSYFSMLYNLIFIKKLFKISN